MVDALLSGKTVPVNDTKTYDNGVKVVPAYLLKPVIVDKCNWKPVLVDSGYYKKLQLLDPRQGAPSRPASPDRESAWPKLLEMRGITKRFGAVTAAAAT